jgi:TetR/AcrR family transcriptional repressor of nem operon
MGRTREFNEENTIAIATNLFWEKGYNAVSTQDLLDAFGIGRSSMYAAYKDKHSLFILALQHYRKMATQSMLDELSKEGPFIETITQLLNQLVKDTLKDSKSKGCFIVNTAIELAPHDEEILAIVQDNRSSIINALSTAIQKGIENKELSKKNNPKALANYFYNLISGLRVDGKVTKDKSMYQDTVNIALTVLEPGKKAKV